MARGLRKPDIIATQIEYFLYHVLDVRVSTRNTEALILREIKEHFLFQQLVQSAPEASSTHAEQLAHALLSARRCDATVTPIIDTFARRFIYPHRVKRVVVYDLPPYRH